MALPPPRPYPTHRLGSNEKRPTSPSPKVSPVTKAPVVVLGVCAMDVKARSKAMREILTRLVEMEQGGVDVKIFGDPVILEEGEYQYLDSRATADKSQISTTGRR